MHYVIGDIHNELNKLNCILQQISLTKDDLVYILGDLFDRGAVDADPVGVFFKILGIQNNCVWIRGNHDQWLAEYIQKFYTLSKRKRQYFSAYHYNSFELLNQRLSEVDMLNLADYILKLPLQEVIKVGETKYLLAHAMTSHPLKQKKLEQYYLLGTKEISSFLNVGINDYVSLLGHTSTSYMGNNKNGKYLDEKNNSIWTNENNNVVLMDCGCGFVSGKLACICLETGKRYYSEPKNSDNIQKMQ